MSAQLRCTLYPGQFSSEFAVVVESFDGGKFSLFASRDIAHADREPTTDAPTKGWLRVQVLSREGATVLVQLPQTTIENGPYLSVRRDQLQNLTETATV